MQKIFFLFLFLLLSTKTAFADSIKINEFLADPVSGEDEWVEIYAPSTENLNGYYLQDKIDHDNNKTDRTLDGIEHCGDYFIYKYTGDGWLNNNGDEGIYLFSPDDSVNPVDSYPSFVAPDKGKTVGRIPDGSGGFKVNKEPSECAANIEDVPSPASDPSPSPSPTPTTSTSSTKSPSPSPKAKTSPSPSPKPSSSPNQSTPSATQRVLGLQDSISSLSADLLASPSPNPTSGTNTSKALAGILIGSGAILIGASIAAYFWHSKGSQDTENPQIKKDKDRFENTDN